eukprot:351175-Chlamydomonas_euryale.AAC.4
MMLRAGSAERLPYFFNADGMQNHACPKLTLCALCPCMLAHMLVTCMYARMQTHACPAGAAGAAGAVAAAASTLPPRCRTSGCVPPCPRHCWRCGKSVAAGLPRCAAAAAPLTAAAEQQQPTPPQLCVSCARYASAIAHRRRGVAGNARGVGRARGAGGAQVRRGRAMGWVPQPPPPLRIRIIVGPTARGGALHP